MTEENEKRVRAFYDATVPGHREALSSLQAPHVVYDLPVGMPVGGGHFEGLLAKGYPKSQSPREDPTQDRADDWPAP